MIYHLEIGDDTKAIDVLVSDDEQKASFDLEGHTYDVTYHRVSEHRFHLKVNGRWETVFVARADTGKHAFIRGRCYFVKNAARSFSAASAPGSSPEALNHITPPMPAVVSKILIEKGDSVKKGQPLVVVNAMKMETTLVSPFDGVVKRINTRLSARVSPGDILVEIHEEGEENGSGPSV